MAKIKIAGIKGMPDMLPEESAVWEFFTDTARRTASLYGFRQIRTPILEQTALFTRGIGEVTDIVEKEMYSFEDSMNGEKLTLRPENTSAVVRCAIEHSLTYNAPQRLWYFGPMFRHERPQRGRYRQFHQFGCEALGFAGPDIDVELLAMIARLWKELGIEARLELNTLGELEERAKHREALIAYFQQNADILDEDAKRRLLTNPLRILDTKNPDMQEMVNAAPKLLDFLGEKSLAFLKKLEDGVSALGISYTVNPRLVRGLDYYNHTVFEWITDKLGSQGTICGGGRYDPLIEMLGGRPTPAAGFAIGAERVIELMKEVKGEMKAADCDVYIVHHEGEAERKAVALGEILRDKGLSVVVHAGSTAFKTQMKRADQSLAQWCVIAGEGEVAEGKLTLKHLRNTAGEQVFEDQVTQPEAEVIERIVKG
ncbi:histidine--tRNA ligase [Duodenibacillus massiliensis]|uniref:histidine--tRNA ligase n=1 Tax=Duodenibacillus massiliensis TaxID=1852381 RepID=UPI003AB36FE2|nr:histidine--tRNA ligase [Duodenibacillus sp.]